MPSSLMLLAATTTISLVLIAVLLVQRQRGRRSVHQLTQQRAAADARTGALVHELSQPLTAILSNAQAAQRFLTAERPDVHELREILSDIVTDDKRAAEIVRSLSALLEQTKVLVAGSDSRSKRGDNR